MTDPVILFDLDETLVVETQSVKDTFLAAGQLAQVQYGVVPDRLEECVRRRAKALWTTCRAYPYCAAVGISSWEGLWGQFTGTDENLVCLRQWVPEYRVQAWSGGLAECGIDDATLAGRLAEAFVAERRTRHVLFPETLSALRAFDGRCKLAIITNGAPDIQQEKIDRTGIGGFFETIVISGTVGVGKPHPKTFLTALEALRASPSQAVMIGDSLKHDIKGARDLGIKGVWMNRYGQAAGPEHSPDAIVSDLNELPTTLANLGVLG